MTRSPIKRPGGKFPLLRQLLVQVERGGAHTCYAEVFGGGLALLLNKPRSQVEVINDIDGDIVNAWTHIQNHMPEIRRLLRQKINARQVFIEARSNAAPTAMQRAADWLFLNSTCFGGDNQSFGVQKLVGGGAASRLSRKIPNLREARKRLDGVIIEHLGWERMFRNYDGPHTLWFLDPPYVGGSQKDYAAWTMEQMEAFANAVRRLKGKWIVTVGGTPEMEALWDGFQTVKEVRSLVLGPNRKGKRFAELIITNF